MIYESFPPIWILGIIFLSKIVIFQNFFFKISMFVVQKIKGTNFHFISFSIVQQADEDHHCYVKWLQTKTMLPGMKSMSIVRIVKLCIVGKISTCPKNCDHQKYYKKYWGTIWRLLSNLNTWIKFQSCQPKGKSVKCSICLIFRIEDLNLIWRRIADLWYEIVIF